MSGVGLAVSYFASSLYYIFFTFGVLAGCGFGIAYIPAITAVSYYFETKLTFAAGVAASGVGVGNFLYPAMIRVLINKYDWRSSLLIIGGITLNVCLFGAVIRPIDRPELSMKDRPAIDITPFRKKGYIMLCINNFLWCCGISALYIHLTALAEAEGIQADHSAYLISGLGIANLIGRFGYGVLGQQPRMNVIVLYAFSFCLGGICLCVLPLVKSYPGIMCIAILFGIFSGCFGTLLVAILVQLLGLHRFANGYGCLLLFEAAGQLTGGPLTGFMYDLTQSYTLSFILGGGLCIASSIIMIHPYLYVKKHLHEVEPDIPEKEALASSMDIPQKQYPSTLNVAKMAVSMDLIPAAHKLSSIQNLSDTKKMGSVDVLPATKRLLELRKYPSTASV